MKRGSHILPVMESFYSIQGEGYHSGKPAYFVRLAGCNVNCKWCDVKESWHIHENQLVKIMKKLNPSSYWEWLNKLGINKRIETDLYESTPGYLKSKDIFVNQPIEQAVASFGQGFSISPLKLAQIHAILANGGYEIVPHVTQDFKKESKNKKNKLFSEEVSKTVLEWMETVVENGTGIDSKIDGYRIGGKTGTSQKAINGIYTTKKVCSFVAALPINDPKYVVLVLIDEPTKAYAYGSTVAVPVVKEIIESLIVLEKLPPNIKEDKIIVKKP